MDSQYLSASELGKLFHVSRQAIHKWAGEGRFPQPLTPGRVKRWSYAEVEGFVRAQARPERPDR